MWIYKDKSEAEFVREISTLSDRLVGILAPIVLDDRLKLAIQHRWVDNQIRGGTTIFADLFSPSGEIGSFGTKIRVGFALGLYGPDSYSDLVHIEKTRNAFAHRLNVKRFADQPIIDHVQRLTINDRWPETRPLPLTLGEHTVFLPDEEETAKIEDSTTPRGKFLRAVRVLSHLLYIESKVRRADPRTPVF